ncbi:MAG: hypothetical protein BWY17_00816 [Deltaproteobacteria bacterium ADurb.Bin207]|nr:MAG: hypothetical protein BWY17_00816 [Deltaproteobacteria bacterium ADurb.Bin207]
MRVCVHFTPKSNGRLRSAKAILHGEEIAWTMRDTDDSTRHQHDLDKIEGQMCEALPFYQNQPQELSCELPVPNHAAPSFDSSNNCVQWNLEIHLLIENSPDLKETIPITLLPSA